MKAIKWVDSSRIHVYTHLVVGKGHLMRILQFLVKFSTIEYMSPVRPAEAVSRLYHMLHLNVERCIKTITHIHIEKNELEKYYILVRVSHLEMA